MSAYPSQELELPPRLAELDFETKALIERAAIVQADINASTASNDQKLATVHKAVGDLDRLADGVYLGEDVQIEGSYEYPQGWTDGSKFSLEPRSEYGIRRGQSLGFYSSYGPKLGADGEPVSEKFDVEFVHGIVMSDVSFGNRMFNLIGRAMINAPIEKSSLVLAEIEDYRKLVFAELFVRQSKRDSRWTDTIDLTLYNEDGPDLRALGSRLNRLRSLRADRVEEYLTYINIKLNNQANAVELICDTALMYAPGVATPTLMKPNDPIVGTSPDICFADAWQLDEVQRLAYRLSKPTPTLSLRAFFEDREGAHILHIPLSGIQLAEYK